MTLSNQTLIYTVFVHSASALTPFTTTCVHEACLYFAPTKRQKKNFGNLKLIAEKRTQHYAKYLYFSENSKLMAINWKLETRRYVVFSLITVNIHFFFYSLVQTL